MKKKLLTVLLALAVVFTYSVPAFAVTNDAGTFNGNVNLAQQQIMATLDTNYANAVKSLTSQTINQTITVNSENKTVAMSISKDAMTSAAQLYKDKVVAAIIARTNDIKSKYDTLGDKTVNELVALYAEVKTTGTNAFANSEAVDLNQGTIYTGITSDADVQAAAARTQFAADKDSALSAVKSVDLSVYSTTTPTTGTAGTYNVQAKKVVDDTVAAINDITLASDATLAVTAKAYYDLGAFANATYNVSTGETSSTDATLASGVLKAITKIVKNDTAKTVYGYKLNSSIPTITDEAANATTLSAMKAAFISKVNANSASFLAAYATATGDTATTVKAENAAYVTGMTEIINAATTKADLFGLVGKAATVTLTEAINAIPMPTTSTYYAADAKLIAQLEATAAKYKAYKDADGNFVQDSTLIDKVVADAKVAAYTTAATNVWNGANTATFNASPVSNETAEAKIMGSYCKAAATVSSSDVAKKKADVEAARKLVLQTAGEDNYYTPEADQVNAIYDAVIAKIDAAKTTSELNAITIPTIATAEVAAIKNKTAIKTAIAGFSGYTANNAKVVAYEGVLNAGTTDTRNFVAAGLNDSESALKASYWTDFYATNGARTSDQVVALLDKAKAACEAVKTASQLTAEKKAVEAQIAALPSTITAADAEAVKAAFDAATAYNNDAGKTMDTTDVANIATLKLAATALQNALTTALTAEANALPTNVTVADKDAVKAVLAKYEAFNEYCGTDKIFPAGAALSTTTLNDKLTAIRGLEKAAVEAAINALPLNITMDNKAAVEAARKAYDAYVAEYTDYTAQQKTLNGVTYYPNAANDFGNTTFKALADAEAQLAAAETAQAKLVQAYKIIASSKAYKIGRAHV